VSIRGKVVSILATGMLLWSQVASACPQCASREGGGYGGVLLLGGMILSPIVIAMISWRVIGRLTDSAEQAGVVESENGGMA
jgi:hypothetical protein